VPEVRSLRKYNEYVTLLVKRDPRTGKALQRIARGAESWDVSPDGKRILVVSATIPRQAQVLTAEGKVIATRTALSRAGEFLPDGKRVRIFGDVWNPDAKFARPTNPLEDEELVASRDGKSLLRVEDRGREGVFFPLGYLLDAATGKSFAMLEGQTGWSEARPAYLRW
jgi:hypothetical protein